VIKTETIKRKKDTKIKEKIMECEKKEQIKDSSKRNHKKYEARVGGRTRKRKRLRER
jgi:hypothetical protein